MYQAIAKKMTRIGELGGNDLLLKEIEKNSELLIINTNEPFVLVDKKLKILTFNLQFEKKYQDYFSKQLVRGQSILDFSQHEKKETLKAIYKSVFKGKEFSSELELTSKHGEINTLLLNYKPAYNVNGDIVGAFVSSTDISEIKKTQRQLHETENHFKALIENSGDFISLTDHEGKIIYLSPSFKKITNAPLENLIGKSAFEIIHRDYVEESKSAFQELIQNPGIPIPRKNRFLNKNGDDIWVEGVTTNLLHDPSMRALVANYKDVSERFLATEKLRHAESRFRMLIDNNYDGIVLRDKDLSIIFSSASSERILGWTDTDKLGKTFSDTTHPDDVEKIKANNKNVLENPGVPFPLIFRTMHKAGHYVWVERVMTNLLHDKAINAIVANFRDITERKTLEGKIEENTSQLVRIKNQLQYSETRLKQAQAMAHMGNWELNLTTNNSFWSEEACRIFGLDPEERTIPLETWKTFIHPEDLKDFEVEIENASKLLRDSTHTHRIVRKDGTVRHVISESRYELNADGFPIGLYGLVHDITDRLTAERELFESHELLQKLTTKVPVAVYRFQMDEDGKTRFPFMSKVLTDLLPGIDLEQLKFDGSSVFSNVHPEDINALFESIAVSKKELSVWNVEFRAYGPNNELYWLHASSRPEEKKAGTIEWYGYLQNITEKKLADDKIRIAKERYDLVAKATNEAIWDWDLVTNELHWGEGFKNLFGHELKTDVLTIDAWSSQIHPQDRKKVLESIRKVLCAPKEIQWKKEYRYSKADGSYASVLDRGYITRNKDGKATRMIGAMQDISERKRSEEQILLAKERYDIVAKATNDALYDWDLKTGKVYRTGDGINILFGYTDLSVIADPHFWHHRIHPDDFEETYSLLQKALNNSNDSTFNCEYRFRKVDGNYAFVFDKGIILRDDKGIAVRMIGATQDISRIKESEILLTNLNNMLEKRAKELAISNTELEQFAYIASHDLQEPLRMVTSFLTQLESKYKGQLDDKAKQYIHFATDGAVRMRRLILDLLEYSRAGKQLNNKVEINTNDLLSDTIKLNRTIITEKNAIIDWKDLPVIRASKTALQQVFQNLIVNALKYHKPNTIPFVRITAKETNTHWQFAVSDNGIGIEERYFEKIFVIFQRLHNKDEYSGTGIGLAICKKIIESHQGHIWVTSEYDAGSTFHFTIAKQFTETP